MLDAKNQKERKNQTNLGEKGQICLAFAPKCSRPLLPQKRLDRVTCELRGQKLKKGSQGRQK